MKTWINGYELLDSEVDQLFWPNGAGGCYGVRVPYEILKKANCEGDFATDTDSAGLLIEHVDGLYTNIEDEEHWIFQHNGEWQSVIWYPDKIRRAHPIITAAGLAEAERLNDSGHPGWDTIRKLRRRCAEQWAERQAQDEEADSTDAGARDDE